jgi:hypothetical protein
MQRIILLALTLTACATVGKKFDTTHVHEIQKGTQTKSEITAWFGPAHSSTQLTQSELGCVERWQWMHARSRPGSTKSQVLIVDFDSDGKVCDNAYSQK